MDQLLMAANYMTEALKHHHHDVSFTKIYDYGIFPASNNFQKQVPKAFSAGNHTSTN
jgi:hypothetical protein